MKTSEESKIVFMFKCLLAKSEKKKDIDWFITVF